MFCKCYFAALWESAHAKKEKDGEKSTKSEIEIRPQVKIEPIFLPAISYLVESSAGYLASVWARFQQARRHMQGVVELGYVLLQYTRLTNSTGFLSLPWRTHVSILSILIKMLVLHIISTAQCFTLIVATVTTIVPAVWNLLSTGGLYSFLQNSDLMGFSSRLSDGWDALNFAQQALAASFGQISGVTILYSVCCFIVTKDLIEGYYYKVLSQPNIVGTMPPVGEGDEATDGDSTPMPEELSHPSTNAKEKRRNSSGIVQQCPRGCMAVVRGVGSWPQRVFLCLSIIGDTLFVGYTAIALLAMIPSFLAACSLFRRGIDFEYIVAPKPE